MDLKKILGFKPEDLNVRVELADEQDAPGRLVKNIMVFEWAGNIYKTRVWVEDKHLEWPTFGDDIKPIGQWSTDIMHELYIHSSFCSKDDLRRPMLKGVLVSQIGGNQLNAVSTDGHCLRLTKNMPIPGSAIEESWSAIILHDVLKVAWEAIKKINLKNETKVISLARDTYLQMSLPRGIMLFSQLIDEKFVNYSHVIREKSEGMVVFRHKEVCEAVSAIYGLQAPNVIKLNILDDKLVMEAADEPRDSQDWTWRCEKEAGITRGERLKIGVDPRLLKSVLGSLSGDRVSLEYQGEFQTMIFKQLENPKPWNVMVLLMPTRIAEVYL